MCAFYAALSLGLGILNIAIILTLGFASVGFFSPCIITLFLDWAYLDYISILFYDMRLDIVLDSEYHYTLIRHRYCLFLVLKAALQ